MKMETRIQIDIWDCTVHYRKAPRGWAIVVMPDKFKVDNYYHGMHVHPDREVIPIKDPDIIFNIICNHIQREEGLIESKLRKELGL